MSTTDAQKLAIVDALYAATGVGNFDLAETMLTDDFFVEEAAGLPMAGTYRGKGALRELFIKVMGMVDVTGLDRKVTCVGGDCVIVLVDFMFADPSLKRAEVAEVFRFRGDKVCEIRPFYFEPGVLLAAVAAKRAKG